MLSRGGNDVDPSGEFHDFAGLAHVVVDCVAVGWGFPCCVRSPSVHAAVTTPVQRLAYSSLISPGRVRLPRKGYTSSFSRLARRSLVLRPAHSRGYQFVTRYPKASDSSSPPCLLRLLPAGANRRVGLAPTGKRRLVTAHTKPTLPKAKSNGRVGWGAVIFSGIVGSAIKPAMAAGSAQKARYCGYLTKRAGIRPPLEQPSWQFEAYLQH